jgi:hypothetical protein
MTFKKFSAAAAYTRPSETWYKNYIKFRIFASEKGRICGLYPEADNAVYCRGFLDPMETLMERMKA